jgi:hypothetical protein
MAMKEEIQSPRTAGEEEEAWRSEEGHHWQQADPSWAAPAASRARREPAMAMKEEIQSPRAAGEEEEVWQSEEEGHHWQQADPSWAAPAASRARREPAMAMKEEIQSPCTAGKEEEVWQSEEEGHPWQQAVPSWADFPPSPSTTEPRQTMEEESERGHDSEPEQEPAAPAERPLTHYEVLNMPRDASTSELRSAWKKGCLARHPDKPWGNAAAFLQLSKAWEVLGDPISRASYDASM